MRRLLGLGMALLFALGVTGADPVVISGRVVTPDGQPVAGARVLVTRSSREYGSGLLETVTDTTGAFRLRTETYRSDNPEDRPRPPVLLVRKDGLALTLVTAETPEPLNITLEDKVETRSATLRDAAGQPVAQADVIVTSLFQAAGRGGPEVTHNLGSSLRLAALSDAQGQVCFSGYGAGTTLTAEVSATGFAPQVVRLTGPTPATVTLQREARVSGRVTRQGQPVDKAEVSLSPTSGGSSLTPWRSGWQRTGPDGVFSFRGLPAGAVEVRVSDPSPDRSQYVGPSRQTLTLQAGDDRTNVDFNFTTGAVVKGTVTDLQTGQPVPNTQLWAEAPGATERGMSSYNATASATGGYQMRLAPGTYVLKARAPYAYGIDPAIGQTLTLTEGQVVEGHDFKVGLPRKVTVTVRLPDGQPAPGAKLSFFNLSASARQSQSGADGLFEVYVSPRRPRAPAADAAPATPKPGLLVVRALEKNLCGTLVTALEEETLTLSLQPGASVSFTVRDTAGQPLRGIRCGVYLQHEQMTQSDFATATSDEKGLVRVAALPAGVKVWIAPDWNAERLVVTTGLPTPQTPCLLEAGQERALPDLVLNPKGRSLAVRVADDKGQPVRNARVFSYYHQQAQVANDQGQVELTRLPLKGQVAVMAMHPTEALFAADTVEPDGSPWPGLVLKPLGQATGLLIARPGGRALPGLKVVLRPTAGQWLDFRLAERAGQPPPRQERSVVTDADGRWTWEGLVAGATYTLWVMRPIPGQEYEGGNSVGEFRADGGPNLQDIGIMEYGGPGAE